MDRGCGASARHPTIRPRDAIAPASEVGIVAAAIANRPSREILAAISPTLPNQPRRHPPAAFPVFGPLPPRIIGCVSPSSGPGDRDSAAKSTVPFAFACALRAARHSALLPTMRARISRNLRTSGGSSDRVQPRTLCLLWRQHGRGKPWSEGAGAFPKVCQFDVTPLLRLGTAWKTNPRPPLTIAGRLASRRPASAWRHR
jgi:hypothetical protein